MPSLADNLPYTQMPWDQTTWMAGLADQAQNAPRFKPHINNMALPSYSGGLGSNVAGAAGNPGSTGNGTGFGGALGQVNQLDQLINRIGGPGTVSGPFQTGLGDINSLYSLYNAYQHPSIATGISGAAGAAHLYNQAAPALGGTALPGNITTGLSGVGDIAGIYNAIKHPTAGNIASGLYDARNLYGIGSNIAQNMGLNSAISSAAAPGLANAAAGAGIGDLSAAPGLSSAMSGAAGAGADMSVGALGGAGTGAGASGALGTLGGYSSSPEVSAAINATVPDAAGAGGTGLGSVAAPAALAAAWLYGLGRAFSTDKFNDTPMGQLNVTNQSGPAGRAVYDSMTSTAAKYGDINDPATWNIAKWNPADQQAVNYGRVGLTQPKHGRLLSN